MSKSLWKRRHSIVIYQSDKNNKTNIVHSFSDSSIKSSKPEFQSNYIFHTAYSKILLLV